MSTFPSYRAPHSRLPRSLATRGGTSALVVLIVSLVFVVLICAAAVVYFVVFMAFTAEEDPIPAAVEADMIQPAVVEEVIEEVNPFSNVVVLPGEGVEEAPPELPELNVGGSGIGTAQDPRGIENIPAELIDVEIEELNVGGSGIGTPDDIRFRDAESADPLLQQGYEHAAAARDDEAMSCFRRAAEAGSAEAMMQVGLQISVTVKDPLEAGPRAVAWYEKAAEAGHVPGMVAAGEHWLWSVGDDADPTRAREWFEKAAHEGSASAMANLGAIHEKGLGVTADEKLATSWYRLAARAEDFGAQEWLRARELDW